MSWIIEHLNDKMDDNKVSMELDPNTFGDFKAAVVLVDMLNEINDRKLTASVARNWTSYCNCLAQIKTLKEYQVCLAGLLRKSYIEKIEKSDYPQLIKTYFINIISSKFKVFCKYVQENNNPKKRQHYH